MPRRINGDVVWLPWTVKRVSDNGTEVGMETPAYGHRITIRVDNRLRRLESAQRLKGTGAAFGLSFERKGRSRSRTPAM
jgi:hypothetical protein